MQEQITDQEKNETRQCPNAKTQHDIVDDKAKNS